MLRSITRSPKLPIAVGVTLGLAGAFLSTSRVALRAESEPLGALDPKVWIQLPLESSKDISHDTKELVFSIPDDHTLGGKTAYMTMFRFVDKDGKNVIRPYTPVSDPDTKGHATYVIKRYPNGAMSNHVHGLKPGEGIEVKGPIQKYPLEANQHKQIALVGGGAGITPLFQILHKVAEDPSDKTKVSLFYGSKTPKDILLKKEIDEAVAKKPDQLSVRYFVDKSDGDFKGEEGVISKAFLQDNLFGPDEENVKVFVCGPPPLYNAISGNKKSPSDQGDLTGALKELGFNKDQVFKF